MPRAIRHDSGTREKSREAIRSVEQLAVSPPGGAVAFGEDAGNVAAMAREIRQVFGY
jgi:hypothetical protein